MARLASGIRKRSDGKLEKRFTVDGKRYSVYGVTAKEVQRKETELRDAIREGAYQTNKALTFDKYFSEWIQNKEKTVKTGTVYRYKSIYKNHIAQQIGKRRIRELERREISNMIDRLSEDNTVYTCNSVLLVLKAVFNDAVREEILIRNPAQNIKPITEKKTEAAQTIHRALTPEEQKTFMEAARDTHYYELFAFLLCTGLRIGEAAALTWKDIDFKNNMIHVSKTVTRGTDGKLITSDTPKTHAGIRDIPLTDTARGILKSQREKYGALPFATKNIFYNTDGGLITPISANYHISQVLKDIEKSGTHIERFTVHAFRDTFATRFIEQGGQTQTLKTILGHSSLSMTMDLYAHVLPNTKQEEMNRIQIII